jgi:hypothetical protein
MQLQLRAYTVHMIQSCHHNCMVACCSGQADCTQGTIVVGALFVLLLLLLAAAAAAAAAVAV